MQLTKNFNLKEFYCKDGTPVPSHLHANVRELAEQLQVIRDYIGKPILITSGYRTPSYNKQVKGTPRSLHLKGKAADIIVPGMTPSEVHSIVQALIKHKKILQGGLACYSKFVHYDCRGYIARWPGH